MISFLPFLSSANLITNHCPLPDVCDFTTQVLEANYPLNQRLVDLLRLHQHSHIPQLNTINKFNTINLALMTLTFSSCSIPAELTLLINCWRLSILSQKIKVSSAYLNVFRRTSLTITLNSVSFKLS